MKGRVACEISVHEVLLSHLLYQNFFQDLEPPEVVALLSCFVFEQVAVLFTFILWKCSGSSTLNLNDLGKCPSLGISCIYT